MTMRDTNIEALPETVSGQPWTIRSNGRLHNGLIVGRTASGKSIALRAVAREAAKAGCAIWLADPQYGASGFPTGSAARVSNSPEQIRHMLQSAAWIIGERTALLAARNAVGWESGGDLRGLLIVVAEFPSVFDDAERQRLACEIARRGNKVGVAIVAAVPAVRLPVAGGGPLAMVLREALASGGNVALLERGTRPRPPRAGS